MCSILLSISNVSSPTLDVFHIDRVALDIMDIMIMLSLWAHLQIDVGCELLERTEIHRTLSAASSSTIENCQCDNVLLATCSFPMSYSLFLTQRN